MPPAFSFQPTTQAAVHSIAGNEPLLSVVIPIKDEIAVLDALMQRLMLQLDALPGESEVLFVDDGSRDGSAEWIEQAARHDPRIALLKLTRNVGKEAALSAGLDHANGQAVIIMDADLQDPPELIPQMLQRWRDGHDVVLMQRARRDGETLFKRASAALYYRLLRRIANVDIPSDVGDFRLISRRVVLALRQLPERNRYMKGMLAWLGFPSCTLRFERPGRVAGSSRWAISRLFGLATEGITSFSITPLRLASVGGVLCAGIGLLAAVFVLLRTLLYGDPVAGFPTMFISMLFIGGVQLIALGIIGEYVGRIYMEVKQRPLYLVDHYLPSRSSAQQRQQQP